MSNRYDRRAKAINRNKLYEETFEKRNINGVEQYRTPSYTVANPRYDTRYPVRQYRWAVGDTFWRLAARFYGDPKYWWIIAIFNKSPTVAHMKEGTMLLIPVDLSTALQIVGEY